MSTRVAVLGAGNMAGAMVGTLRRAGLKVTVWNRTRTRAETLAERTGATVSGSAAAALEGADVALSSLADDTAVLETYLGDARAVSGCHADLVVLEMSTIAPATVRRIAAEVVARGAGFLDAPVSGSVPAAESGELTVMVGGDAEALARARPVLDVLARKVLHVGPLGAGATVKLAVNALVHAIDVGLSEALVLAERAGVDRSAAYEVFASGAAAAPFVLYKRAAFERPEGAEPAFTLDLMAKDLDLILELARSVGALMAQGERNREVVERALAAGFSGRDMSAVAEFLRRAAGPDPRRGTP
jgi:3-hydroxyisobutyrate dehydrogenase-like beta-hydroxyacid dehydrogenase